MGRKFLFIICMFIFFSSFQSFAASMEIKKSDIFHSEQKDNYFLIWLHGTNEKDYFISLYSDDEKIIKKNVRVNKNGNIEINNIGNEVFIHKSSKTDKLKEKDLIKHNIPLWLSIYGGVLCILIFLFGFYCRKYLVKHK